jgi:glycosyltransferase involved in cell wall biosynthesis
MNLAIFLNLKFCFDGKNYTADERYYQFWTSLTRYFEKVVLCVPVVRNGRLRGNFDVDLKANHVEICHLPIYGPFSVHQLPRIRRIISENIQRWDIVGAVVPSLIGNLFLYQARRHARPYFGYIRGNVKKTAWFELSGYKRCGGYAYFWMLDVVTKLLIKSGLTLVVGQDLLKSYSAQTNAVYNIVVSVISENQIKDESPDFNVLKEPRLLYIGRLSSEKGIAVLLKAVLQLKRKYKLGTELTIAGSGPKEYQLKEYAKTLGIGKDVHFIGYVRDNAKLSRLYQDSDVFILPSYTEGVPKVILEAMANGLPVVATSVGGIPEIIQNGLNGLLVPTEDAEAICDSVYRLLNNEKLRLKMRESALETVRKFTLEKQTENIVGVLDRHFKMDLAEKQLNNDIR